MARRPFRFWEMSTQRLRLAAIGRIARDAEGDLDEAERILRYVRERRVEGKSQVDIYDPGLRLVHKSRD